MRFVQVVVPDEQRDDIVSALRDRELGLSTAKETSGEDDRTLISFIVPADAVEHILDDLYDAGLREEWYIVSIETEFASFQHVDEVQDRWAKTPNRIAPRTLRSKAKDMRQNTRSYLWMMTLSTIIATAGLLVGSPAVVVGSMVLAPIVSPMLTASVGLVRDDQLMVFDSLRMQAIGLGFAIVGATLLSLLLKFVFVVPAELAVANIELIAIRFSPGLLSVVVGLAAGAAGSFSLATKGQVTIVGVMVAAALILSRLRARRGRQGRLHHRGGKKDRDVGRYRPPRRHRDGRRRRRDLPAGNLRALSQHRDDGGTPAGRLRGAGRRLDDRGVHRRRPVSGTLDGDGNPRP
ncbi:hypothetical protein BRC76_06340 [Halobacteriales archaeon QH_8_67_36]|nr:MAG: hypothetical protein BRC76_06340 [Halobacteriales archaeon QH_8_67_36]